MTGEPGHAAELSEAVRIGMSLARQLDRFRHSVIREIAVATSDCTCGDGDHLAQCPYPAVVRLARALTAVLDAAEDPDNDALDVAAAAEAAYSKPL